MNCWHMNAWVVTKGRLGANAVLLMSMVGISVGTWGCSSKSKSAVGQTNPTPDASVLDASVLTDSGTLPNDAGDYGVCADSAPVNPSPSLTGRWALRIVASRLVPQTGLTAEFYTRTVSVLLSDETQTGRDVTFSAQFCNQYAESDPGAQAYVVIPDTYVKSLKPFDRTGTYSAVDGGANVLHLPLFPEVQGAALADPMNDPLPTDASDPAVDDQDNDGNPGITIKLGGLVPGDLYVVQRQIDELTGIAVSNDRVVGRYDYTSEQIVLDSNPSALKVLASQTAKTDPRPCKSTFTMIRVAATWTCADVLADSTLFD
jgi:hypothetical protein